MIVAVLRLTSRTSTFDRNLLCDAELERLFSRVKRVKSKTRCHLSNDRLGNLLHIGQERKDLSPSTVVPAMTLRDKEKRRRPNQSETYV